MELTKKQKEVLSIIKEEGSSGISILNLAFLAQTSPQAVGKIIKNLSSKNLLSVQRWNGKIEIWPYERD